MKPEIVIKFGYIIYLLVQRFGCITVNTCKVGIKHDFHATGGVNQVFDTVRRFYAYKFLHDDSPKQHTGCCNAAKVVNFGTTRNDFVNLTAKQG